MNFLAVILIIGGVTVAVGLLCYAHEMLRHHKHGGASAGDAPSAPESGDEASERGSGEEKEEVCCGMHAVCEKIYPKNADMLPDYYDDEELDRFSGRDPASYSDSEIEEIREVMLTLRPEEVAAWGKSIEMRGIQLTPELRDELLMLIGG